MGIRKYLAHAGASLAFALCSHGAQAGPSFDGQNFARHAGVSAGMACGIMIVTKSRPLAYGATFIAGTLKELYDKKHPGNHSFEGRDFRDNAIGTIAGAEGCRAAFVTDPSEAGRLQLRAAPEESRLLIAPVPVRGGGIGIVMQYRF